MTASRKKTFTQISKYEATKTCYKKTEFKKFSRMVLFYIFYSFNSKKQPEFNIASAIYFIDYQNNCGGRNLREAIK